MRRARVAPRFGRVSDLLANPAARSLDSWRWWCVGPIGRLRALPMGESLMEGRFCVGGARLSPLLRKDNSRMDLNWLSPGDNAWQMTAATFVGLMSVPGLVVLYGGVMQKRWSVNSMMMAFIAFALVLIVWVGYGFKMGFGAPIHILGASGGSFFGNFLGKPGPILDS